MASRARLDISNELLEAFSGGVNLREAVRNSRGHLGKEMRDAISRAKALYGNYVSIPMGTAANPLLEMYGSSVRQATEAQKLAAELTERGTRKKVMRGAQGRFVKSVPLSATAEARALVKRLKDLEKAGKLEYRAGGKVLGLPKGWTIAKIEAAAKKGGISTVPKDVQTALKKIVDQLKGVRKEAMVIGYTDHGVAFLEKVTGDVHVEEMPERIRKWTDVPNPGDKVAEEFRHTIRLRAAARDKNPIVGDLMDAEEGVNISPSQRDRVKAWHVAREEKSLNEAIAAARRGSTEIGEGRVVEHVETGPSLERRRRKLEKFKAQPYLTEVEKAERLAERRAKKKAPTITGKGSQGPRVVLGPPPQEGFSTAEVATVLPSGERVPVRPSPSVEAAGPGRPLRGGTVSVGGRQVRIISKGPQARAPVAGEAATRVVSPSAEVVAAGPGRAVEEFVGPKLPVEPTPAQRLGGGAPRAARAAGPRLGPPTPPAAGVTAGEAVKAATTGVGTTPAAAAVPEGMMTRGAAEKMAKEAAEAATKGKGGLGKLLRSPLAKGVGWLFLAWMAADLVKGVMDDSKRQKVALLGAEMQALRQSQLNPQAKMEEALSRMYEMVAFQRAKQAGTMGMMPGATELGGLTSGREAALARIGMMAQ